MAVNLSDKTNSELKQYVKKHTIKLQKDIRELSKRNEVNAGLNLQVIISTEDDEKDFWGDSLIAPDYMAKFIVSESKALEALKKFQLLNSLDELINTMNK